MITTEPGPEITIPFETPDDGELSEVAQDILDQVRDAVPEREGS